MVRFGSQCAFALLAAALLAWSEPCQARQPRLELRPAAHPKSMDPRDGGGWTELSPSVDSRVVYVSSRQGNDSNDGLSPATPKATIASGYSLLRNGFPDWLLLRRGDEWRESFPEWTKGGRQVGEPIVIGSYGTGDRPLLKTASGRGFMSVAYPSPLAHLAITDIHLDSDRGDGSSLDAGIFLLNLWSDVLIENCHIEGYRDNIVVEPLDGRPSNIRVRRCIVANSLSNVWYSQGIYAGAVDNLLIEECVFDHNGWRRGVPGAHATIFNHNMYLHGTCNGVVTRGNISARASATGISQRCAGISEDNLLLQNPVGVFMSAGVAGSNPPARSAIRNNVVLDARDIDSASPRGFGVWAGGIQSVEIYGNVIANHRTGTENVIAFYMTSGLRSATLSRNLVYDWTIETIGLGLSMNLSNGQGVQVTDNVFVQPSGGFLVEYVRSSAAETGRVFGRNQYFTANSQPHQVFYSLTYPEWVQYADDVYPAFTQPSFPDPGRGVESYMASLGLPPTLDAFLARARLQDKATWDDRFTAAAVNSYVREGFGVGRRGCMADFNDDGATNAFDLSAFQAAYAAGSNRADVDLDGLVTPADLAMFPLLFAQGCP